MRSLTVERTGYRADSESGTQRRELDLVWHRFGTTGDPALRETLITHHLPLVDTVVRRLPAAVLRHWSSDELKSFGTFGLIDAIDKFRSRPSQVPFDSYLSSRIRGAIYDELRKLDWLPRERRAAAVGYRAAEDALRSCLGHSPTHNEVLATMDITSKKTAQATVTALHRAQFESLQAPFGDGERSRGDYLVSADDPDEAALAQLTRDELSRVIAELPKRQQMIISYRYVEGLSQHQVAALLHVSNTRICQLEHKALQELRGLLTENLAA